MGKHITALSVPKLVIGMACLCCVSAAVSYARREPAQQQPPANQVSSLDITSAKVEGRIVTIHATAHWRHHLGQDTYRWILHFRDRQTKQIQWEMFYQDKSVLIGHLQNADPEFKDSVALPPGQYRVWLSLRGDTPTNAPDGTFARWRELSDITFIEVK
jgi:hypothetical protein